jgi:hypothetical protein
MTEPGGVEGVKGSDIYKNLGFWGRVGPDEVSNELANAGIPGIRYLDEGSRAKNVVDAKHLAVLERHKGDWPSAVDEIMRGYYASPKDVAAYRAQLLAKPLPTYNYVGTDPSRLDILAKYGIAGAAAVPPTLGAFTDQSQYEVPDGLR